MKSSRSRRDPKMINNISMFQNWFQNNSNRIHCGYQHGSNAIPTWFQHALVPKWFQSDQNDFITVPNWFQNDYKMFPKWFWTESKTFWEWFNIYIYTYESAAVSSRKASIFERLNAVDISRGHTRTDRCSHIQTISPTSWRFPADGDLIQPNPTKRLEVPSAMANPTWTHNMLDVSQRQKRNRG